MNKDIFYRARTLCEHARRLLGDASSQWTQSAHEDTDDSTSRDYLSNAEENLGNALLALASAAELSSLGVLRDEILRIRPEFEMERTKTAFYADEPYLVWANYLWGVVDIIDQANTVPLDALPQATLAVPIDLVQQVLDVVHRAESAIVDTKAFGWRPTAEDDVHVRLENILRPSFPGLQSKAPISGPTRTHVPDTTISSSSVHLEYKFISPNTSLSVITDEMGADIIGFRDARNFAIISVIYETDRFIRDSAALLQQLRKGASSRIELLVLKGVPSASDDDHKKAESKKTKQKK